MKFVCYTAPNGEMWITIKKKEKDMIKEMGDYDINPEEYDRQEYEEDNSIVIRASTNLIIN